MRLRLLVFLGVVVGVLAAADVAARGYAEREIAAQAEAAVPGGRAEAQIDSFPFVLRLLAGGSVPRLRVSVAPVATRRLTLDSLQLRLEGLRLDRAQLFSGKVEPVGLARGSVAFSVTEQNLSQVIGRPVTIEAGQLFVTVAGRDLEARVRATTNALTFEVEGLPLSTIPLDRGDLVPCRPDISYGVGVLGLGCDFDRVPRALLRGGVRR